MRSRRPPRNLALQSVGAFGFTKAGPTRNIGGGDPVQTAAIGKHLHKLNAAVLLGARNGLRFALEHMTPGKFGGLFTPRPASRGSMRLP